MKSLLIIGAGGHGQVVAECAEACGYENIDFLDDNNPDAVGGIDQLEEVVDIVNELDFCVLNFQCQDFANSPVMAKRKH